MHKIGKFYDIADFISCKTSVTNATRLTFISKKENEINKL